MVAMEANEEFGVGMAKRMKECGLQWEQNEDWVRYFGRREEWDQIKGNKLLRELGRFITWYDDNL